MDNDQKRIREELEAEEKELKGQEHLSIPKLEKQKECATMYEEDKY